MRTEIGSIYTDSELADLLSLLLQIPKLTVFQQKFKILSFEEIQRINQAIPQLRVHKPIQHILGKADFFGLEFRVNRHTLIPRPETEELVDLILKAHSGVNYLRILDIGTGSGCIPIALKSRIKDAHVTGVDISSEAIKIAKWNALRLNTEVQFSLMDVLNDTLRGYYNIIVSNPPYITFSERAEMEPNVLDFEPHLALFVADNDPLRFYKRIAFLASKHLSNKGTLYFEINAKYGAETAEVLHNLNFHEVKIMKDMQGKDRFVSGTWLH